MTVFVQSGINLKHCSTVIRLVAYLGTFTRKISKFLNITLYFSFPPQFCRRIIVVVSQNHGGDPGLPTI